MKTEYSYAVKSNVEMPEANLSISGSEVSFFIDNKFLTKIVLVVSGSMLETEELAHRISQFIKDVLVIEYGNCEIFCVEKKEISDTLESKQVQKNIQCDLRTRKAIKNEEELKEQINDERFKSKAKMISALADGLRSYSAIDKYSNFFKVIEFEFSPESGSMKEDLKKTRLIKLIDQLKDPNCISTSEKKIDDLVELRHACSHLKEKTSFGLSNSELEDLKKIKTQLPLIEQIARELVKN